MFKKVFLALVIVTMTVNDGFSQVAEARKDTSITKVANPLKGLKKADFKDLDPSKPLMLDGVSTPVYSEHLQLIKGEEFMKIMSSRDYIPEVYIDSNKEVKAFVLRRATAMEKSQMIEMEMEDDMSGKSDLIGKKAIPFSVSDIAGNRFDLDDLKGKVIVLNFWFVECKPCVMEMPDLNKLVEKYKGSEVVFLGLAINEKPAIETFLKTTTFKYTIIPDAKAAIRSYNINAFPAHIVIDRNSTVSFSTTGLAPNTIETIDGIIKSLLVSGAQ